MAFSAGELTHISNMALDFHVKKGVRSQTIQDKPLLRAMISAKKEFPGGKGSITRRVKGVYSTLFTGYTHDDTVTYETPANALQAQADWKEHHSGITLTLTELKHDGISVVDSTTSKNTTEHSRTEMTRLASLLKDKLEDMDESHARGLNSTMWQDGSQDAKASPGVKSIVVDNPAAVGTVLGIDQVAQTFWRNRSLVDNSGGSGTDDRIDFTGATPADQVVVQTLQKELRQLRRFGGRPNIALCGSDMLDVIEKELRAKGFYTDTGWQKEGRIDVGVADAGLKGVPFIYDPTLDDLSEAKRCYILDTRLIYPYVMEGEWYKPHNPARPTDQYVMFRALTSTFAVMCEQRNAHGVYEFK